jgi:sn-glycerol 3-phosphate transport system permease protein
MAGTLIIMLPLLILVILMQRWFVRGLISTEK